MEGLELIKVNLADHICTITINNPPMNILSKEFREEFVPFMEGLKEGPMFESSF